MHFKQFICFVLLLGLTAASANSLGELHKLMRQRWRQEAQVRQFHIDVKLWASSLEQFGLEFALFVDQCHRRGSHCDQRRVQRRIWTLRRKYSELRTELATLWEYFKDKVSEEEVLQPTMLKIRKVLVQYDETLKLVYAQSYKLVEQ